MTLADKDIIKALDRLSATILVSAIINRPDMKIKMLDGDILKRALQDNEYLRDAEIK